MDNPTTGASQRSSKKSLVLKTNGIVDFAIQIINLAKGAQFYWFLSLVFTLYYSILCIITSYWKGSDHISVIHYHTYALFSILATYVLVLRQIYQYTPVVYLVSLIFKSLKTIFSKEKQSDINSQTNHAGMRFDGNSNGKIHKPNRDRNKDLNNILRNENVQYLLFAFFHWIFSSPYYGAINPSILYPYVIYAFFHFLNYSRQFIIPILPNISGPVKQRWARNATQFYQMFINRSRMLASNTEIMLTTFYIIPLIKITFRLLLGRFLNGNTQQIWIDFKNLFLFMVTINFLRMRYSVDEYTRTQIMQYDSTLNNILWSPNVPEALRQVLASLNHYIKLFINQFTLAI